MRGSVLSEYQMFGWVVLPRGAWVAPLPAVVPGAAAFGGDVAAVPAVTVAAAAAVWTGGVPATVCWPDAMVAANTHAAEKPRILTV